MEFLSQKPLYSTDPSTKGFDLSSGNMWIYPENYPLREYQFQIVKSALYHNTLVCLPTGLGKTFVAAVVMYNFWRWYPQGKIVFLAPTKPLVAQQINACHDIMGIPSNETIELTGTTEQKKRQVAWMEHRIIFATPQVFQKDLEKMIVPSDRVKCVVVDEAHKALGKHSYCESIRLLSEQNQYFRVLALSATPGGKLDAVQEVVRNLHITHMELRDDKSPDIIPYINERKLDIVLVGLGAELERFKDRYVAIMDRHVRVLVQNNVLRGFAENISKGRIFHLHKEWQQKQNKGGNHGQIMKTMTILMTMYHAYELMVRHGLRAFYNFYENHRDKFWLNDEQELLCLLEEINYYLGPFPDVRPLPCGSLPEIPDDIRFGHNKFNKLKELLLRHFESFEGKEEETRAIVFVEYRDIVNEVYVLLLQSRPLIRPQKFVGQAGQKQKQQKLALEDFRSNKVNVLISTSVGEEGLDVGEVDLIVCFDISQQSPIRLVQRMGRTGRKRDGHIIVLVTDGKEHQTLKSTMSRRDSLNDKVLQSSGIINALHEESPRMVPPEFDPKCQKMVMTIVAKVAPTKGKGKTKEPKKTRKRADVNSKTKNSKFPETSTSKTGGSQSSLMKFFKKSEDPQMEVDDDIVGLRMNDIPSLSVPTNRITQSSQQSLKNNNTIKLSDIRLLSSDNAAVEFLTLCTMKKSENEDPDTNKTRTNPYLPSYDTNTEKNENFFDFQIPDLRILDSLRNITDCVVPSTQNEDDDVMMCEPTNRFNGCNEFYAMPQNDIPEISKFEALLDESSDDSEATVLQPKQAKNDDLPVNEQVDWGENVDELIFEDLLDDWPQESRMSEEKYKPEGKKASEMPCQSTSKLLDEPGAFEDILNSSSDEFDTEYNPQDVNTKSETPEIPMMKNPLEMTINSETKGAFEDILNFSSDDSEPDSNVKNINVRSKTPDEETSTKNPTENTINNESKGAFEDILNISSDGSETDCSLQNVDVKCKISKEKATTKNPAEPTITNESKGAFEDILNISSDGSETDCSLQNVDVKCKISKGKATAKNPAETTINNESKGAFEDILNISSDGSETDCSLQNVDVRCKISKEKATAKNPAETTITNESKGAFEDILNISSDGSETDCSLQNVDVRCKISKEKATTKNPAETTITNESKGAFEDILNISSDDSETDCSLQVDPDVRYVSNQRSGTKNPIEFAINDQSRDSLKAKQIRTPRVSVEIDESADLMMGRELEAVPQNSADEADRRNFKFFSNSPETSTSGVAKNSVEDSDDMLTISQILSEVDQLNEAEDVHNERKVNNDREGQTANERSSSPVFPDRHRASRASRYSGTSFNSTNPRESGKDLVLTHGNDPANEAADSEEDIFGVEDLLVDSDFEAEIDNIEKSVAQNVNTGNKRKSCETIAENTSEKRAKIEIASEKQCSNETVQHLSRLSEGTKNLRLSAAKPLVSTLNLDDCEWNSEVKRKPSTLRSKESAPDTVDLADIDWDSEETKNPTPPPVKKPVPDSVELDDYDWESEDVAKNQTPPPVKEPLNDILLDDCDWSSDFETSPALLKPSTSFQKIVRGQESPKSICDSPNNADRIGPKLGKIDDSTGWLSADKPKFRLSLGKKLTNNIRKSLLSKQTCKKPPATKQDSDSENEFTVGRLEASFTEQVDSDFFAKPDPVDKVTGLSSLGMSNPRRIIRRPLSLRRNDVNKLSINGLSTFAAPKKYTQQQEARNNKIVGAGRQKCASLDLDTRKKKKKLRENRRRIRVRSEFIDDEAEVSSDGSHTSGTSGTDDDLHGFVSYTQNVDDSVDMQAHYLQTLRSPRRAGGFHIRKPRSPSPGLQIYSQALPDEPNSYLYDSFCVAEDDDVFEDSETPNEISILEDIEMSLKSRKRKRVRSDNTRTNQKRRVIAQPTDTSSSEDEMEKLRRQISEESFVLKNRRK